MALSFAQLTTPVTRDEAQADLLALLEAAGFRATTWQQGSVPYTLVMLGAHLFSKASAFWGAIAKQGFVGLATGEGLTRLSASHYDNTRQVAIAAQIRGRFTTASGEGPHAVDVGDVVISDASGHTYRNVAGLGVVYPVNLTSAAPVDLLMEAESSGAGHNVGDGTVTQMVTTYAGVTVSAPSSVGGSSIVRAGVDEESDASLELRDETKWGTLAVENIKAGTINVALNAADAIEKVALDDANPRGAGTVDVYIAAAAGVSGGSDVTAAQTALDARFFGNTGSPPRVQAKASVGAALSITGTVYYNSGYSSADVQAAVEASLLAFIKATPIGGWDYSPGPANVVRVNDIEDAIKSTLIAGAKPVKTVTITTPAADVPVSTFDVVTPPAVYSLTYVAV